MTVLSFPDKQERAERRFSAAMARAEARRDLINTRLKALVGELFARGEDDLVLIEVEALAIDLVADLKGKPLAAGVAEKVAARLRSAVDDAGAA